MGSLLTITIIREDYEELVIETNKECFRLNNKVIDVQYVQELNRGNWWIAFIKCRIE